MIKVLSLWQPYATLLVHGIKKFETRPQSTSHKGVYLIHATKSMDLDCRKLCEDPQVNFHLKTIGYDSWRDLPTGQIVGATTFPKCLQIFPGDNNSELLPKRSSLEYKLGDYTPGRYFWITEGSRALDTPFDYKGQQGYYSNFEPELPEELLIDNLLDQHPSLLQLT